MKKNLALIAVVLLAVATLIWWYMRPVHINDAIADPGAYKGKVTLTGVTSAFSPQDRTIFGLTDTRELEKPGSNPLKNYIPVRYKEGILPAYGDEVRVKGTFFLDQGGYLFIAEKVRTINKHKL